MVKPKFACNTISIDIMGSLPTSVGNLKFFFTINNLNKKVEAQEITDTGAGNVVRLFLISFMLRHGYTQYISPKKALASQQKRLYF